MSTTTKKKVTKKDAEKVLAAVKKAYKPWISPGYGPELVMDFDWFGTGAHPAIVWEGGPYEWTYLFPFGGIEGEFGFKIPDVSDKIPASVFTEADTGWALGIHLADW